MFRSLFVSLMLLCGVATAQDLQPVPTPARVVDTTGTLSAGQVQTLATRLKQVSDQNNVVIAVLIVTTSKPETIDAYSLRAFNTWQLGKANKDNGVLISLAKSDRTVRITTGYGVQGTITSQVAQRIVSTVLVPAFKQGDFYGGINNAVSNITSYMPAARPQAQLQQSTPQPNTTVIVGQSRPVQTSGGHGWTIFLVIVLLFVAIIAILALVNRPQTEKHVHMYNNPASPESLWYYPSQSPTVIYPPSYQPSYVYVGGVRGYYDPTGIFIAGLMTGAILDHATNYGGNTTIINNGASASYNPAPTTPVQDDNSLMGDMGGRSGGTGGSESYAAPAATDEDRGSSSSWAPSEPASSDDSGSSSSWGSSSSSDSGSSSSFDSGSSSSGGSDSW